jgi:hypothetical protein
VATFAPTDTLPDDILGAILELARLETHGKRLAFRGHDVDLQRIFHELSQNPDYGLLRQFVFSSSGPRPYSPALSDSVSKLQLGGLLARENPDYEVLVVTSPATRFYKEVLSRQFSTAEMDQLRQIAKDFLSKVQLV